MVHEMPFHRSTRVTAGDVGVACEFPTAKQLVVLAHVTPTSALEIAPTRFGLATIFHCVPFHRSISVCTVPCAVM